MPAAGPLHEGLNLCVNVGAAAATKEPAVSVTIRLMACILYVPWVAQLMACTCYFQRIGLLYICQPVSVLFLTQAVRLLKDCFLEAIKQLHCTLLNCILKTFI